MLQRRNFLVYAAVSIAFVPGLVCADSFRCGAYLIREGMPAAEVKEKCGAPDSVKTVKEPIMATRPNGSTFQVGVTTTEYWRYERGPGQFPALIKIDNNIAAQIRLQTRN